MMTKLYKSDQQNQVPPVVVGWVKALPLRKHVCNILQLFLIVRSKGGINLNFRVNFRKCNILQFLINGHPWDRLVYELHEKL